MPKKPLKTLKAKADRLHSLATRYRFGEKIGEEWYCTCVTCGNRLPLKQMHCGHFQSRRYSGTRYSEENTAPQDPRCNTFNSGEQFLFAKFIDSTYGTGAADALVRKARQTHKLTIGELEEIIHDRQAEIDFYLSS